MSKILVTGDQGWIGSSLVNKLVEDHEVYGYDLKTTTIFPDKPVDLVYHLASHVNAYASVADPRQGLDNIKVLFDVLEWMRESGSKKIIFASSREVFSLENSYGASKAAGEAFITAYCKSYDFAAVSTRIANVYGPNNLGHRFMGDTARKAKNNEDITIYGGEKKILNFIHVSDVVRAFIDLQKELEVGTNKIIEVCYPVSFRLQYIAEEMCKRLNSKSRIIMAPNRKGETLEYRPGRGKNWDSCKVDLMEGINECLSE